LDRPGLDLGAVLEQTPGLKVRRLGGLGDFATVSVRGSTADQVRVYLDGVLLNSSEGGGVDLSGLLLGPVERIEVYRGAAPSLYGGSAIGGVVHLHTQRARRPRVEVGAGGGSFASRTARALLARPGSRVSWTAAIDYAGSEGDFSYEHDNGTAYDTSDDRRLTRSNNTSNAVASLLRAEVGLGAGLRLTLQDTLHWRDRGLPGVALYETERVSLEELRNLASLLLEPTQDPQARLRWQARAALAATRRRLSDPLGEVGVGQQRTDDRSWSPQLGGHLRYRLLAGLHAQLALAYRYEQVGLSDEPDDQGGSATGSAASRRHTLEATAATDIDLAAVETELTLAAGAELVDSEQTGRDPLGGWLDSGAVRGLDGSVRVGLVQRSLPHTLLKANLGRSVRQPSLFELFGDTGYVRGNAGLSAERSLFADLGLVHSARWLPRPQRVQAEIFVFASQVDDLIQFVQSAQNVSVAENVAAARLTGVEAGLRADLLRHLRLRGSLSALLSEDRSELTARHGKQLPYRPRLHGFGRAEAYARGLPGTAELALFAEVEGSSGNYLDPANLVATEARMFVAVGVRGRLLGERLSVEVVGRNLLDSRVVDLAGFPLPGRSVFASVQGRLL